MVTYYITTSILLSSVTTVVCCMSLKICLSIWFNCFVLVFCVLHCPWPSFAYLLINSCKLSVLIRPTWGYTGGGSVDSLPHLVCLAGGQLACVFANCCSCVSSACMEREWRLPSLPTTGPGLHLLLWEEDSAGGAGEGLHVLQACKETKEGAPSSWESQFSYLHTASTTAQWRLLAVSGSMTTLIHSVLSGMDKTYRTPPRILTF